MREFTGLDDWAIVSQQIRGNIRPLYNQQHRRQLLKLHDNLYRSVTELSKTDIERRRTHCPAKYVAQLAIVKEQLAYLQQWLVFATLLDEKPEE